MTVDDALLQKMFERFGVQEITLRSEVREFSRMDQSSQLVYLFLALRTARTPVRGHVYNALYATALALAYAVAHWLSGGAIPWPGGGHEGG